MIDLEFRPAPPDLSDHVVGFAQRRDRAAQTAGRELPMANPMIQFMLGGDYRVEEAIMPRAALWGPTARAATSRTDAPAEVFMVVLTALGASRLARSDLASLINQAVDLDALDQASWRGAADQLAGLGDFNARAESALSRLRRSLSASSPPRSLPLNMADAILGHRLRGTVSAAADRASLSVRGLHCAFAREVGCGPKRLMRIARLQRVLRALHPRPWSPAAPEDALLEFVDQAHLDRDFRDLTGLSRAAYVTAKITRGDRLVHTVV